MLHSENMNFMKSTLTSRSRPGYFNFALVYFCDERVLCQGEKIQSPREKKKKKSKIWILKIYLLNFSVSETILRSYKGCWINCTMLKKYYFVSLCSSTRQWLQYFLFYLKLTINNFKRKDTQAQAKWVNCHCSL